MNTGYVTVLTGQIEGEEPTDNKHAPVLDFSDTQWAAPTADLLRAVLAGLERLSDTHEG